MHKNSGLWDYIDPIIIDTLWEYDIEIVKSMPKGKRDFFLMQISDYIYEKNLSHYDESSFADEQESLDDVLYDRVLDITKKVFEYYN